MKLLISYALAVSLMFFVDATAEGDGKAPVLYTPTFETTKGIAQAGTAFIIKFESRYYAITAQHLIGTAGGLDKDYTGKDLDSIFKSVKFTPIFNGYKVINSTEFISILNAKPISDTTQ
ncbi:hypothetical protein [Pleionea sediminis]|uniref:hypothetical protein n=1 Tax=Pleionea sediminis TaxID=2569479 RepID=UPI001185E136|nr:hypothetical protein [Pleionea sediminis]